jgi:hypothetical protein
VGTKSYLRAGLVGSIKNRRQKEQLQKVLIANANWADSVALTWDERLFGERWRRRLPESCREPRSVVSACPSPSRSHDFASYSTTRRGRDQHLSKLNPNMNKLLPQFSMYNQTQKDVFAFVLETTCCRTGSCYQTNNRMSCVLLYVSLECYKEDTANRKTAHLPESISGSSI